MSLPLATTVLEEQLLARSSELVGADAWGWVLVSGVAADGEGARPGFLGGMGGGVPLSALGMVGDLIPGERGLRGLDTFPGVGEWLLSLLALAAVARFR